MIRDNAVTHDQLIELKRWGLDIPQTKEEAKTLLRIFYRTDRFKKSAVASHRQRRSVTPMSSETRHQMNQCHKARDEYLKKTGAVSPHLFLEK